MQPLIIQERAEEFNRPILAMAEEGSVDEKEKAEEGNAIGMENMVDNVIMNVRSLVSMIPP